jgi:uncharacterized protein
MNGASGESRVDANRAAPPMRVVVVGGTGVVGFPLVERLVERGHAVTVLSRCATPVTGPPGARLAAWEPESGAGLAQQFEGAEAVIHLARTPLPMRWTREAREALFATRLGIVRRMVDAVASLEKKPAVFLCGSSHDFYGERPDAMPLSEAEPPGTDVFARLYSEIEAEAQRLRSFGVRVALARIGVVIGPRASNPKWIQHMVADPRGALSWVHVADCARMLRLAVESGLDGPVNVTARKPTTAVAVAEHFRRREGRKPGIDALALRAALKRGRPAVDLRVKSMAAREADAEDHVSYQPHWAYPRVMEELQYEWQIPDIRDALSN